MGHEGDTPAAPMPYVEMATLGDGAELERRLDPVGERVRHAVTPLFRGVEGRRKPELIGNGVAFTFGDRYYLLTACHVVKDLGTSGFNLWTPERWIPANVVIARTEPQKPLGPDPLDAAVIRLNRGTENEFIRQHALKLDDLDISQPEEPLNHLMQLVSYPGGDEYVRVVEPKAISPTWFQWTGVGGEKRDYDKRGKKPDRHLLFLFDRSQALNREGRQDHGPDMRGASGGGIWRMLPSPEDRERNRHALLTAVFTDFEGRTIIGTRVPAHLQLLKKYFLDRDTPDSVTAPR